MSKQNGLLPNSQQSIVISDSESEQFQYNSDFQRHIGKRTGNYYGRIYPKQNFDGFPRFSQYQSHRNTETSSLARELQGRNSISDAYPNKSRQSEKQGQPFTIKESPILIPVDQNNSNSSRMPEIALPGFGEQEISSIKRRTSMIRPSQIKSYKDLINQIQADQFKQFIFNEEQIEYLTNSAQKEKEEQEERKKLQINKPKRNKKSRVSFNQKEPQKLYCYSFKKNKYPEQDSQASLKVKSEEQDESNSQAKFHIIQDKVKVQEDDINFNTATSYPDNFSNDKPQQRIEPKKQQQKKKQKKTNRKKKQLRITDDPEYSQQNQQPKIDNKKGTKTKTKKNTKSKDKKVQEKQRQKQKQKQKEKQKQKQIEKQMKQKVTKKTKVKQQPQIKKVSSREINRIAKAKTKNQILERLGSDENQLQNNRYPKRTRIKPVQYWDNEKVHYKAGRAMGIQNAHLNFKDLINTNDYYQSHINVNFHTHDIDIDVIIPGKKDLISNGIKDPYEILQIELRKQQNPFKLDQDYQVYFDDNLKSERMLLNSIIIVNSCTYFEISNRSLFPIVLMMRLKVKVGSQATKQ